MEKEEALKRFGLNDFEVKVYLELLKMGSSKANLVSKKVSWPRSTVYSILDSLAAKGLVSHVIKSGVKYFEAADPNNLLSILKEKEKYIEGILPELEKIRQTVKEKPKVEFFEGKAGIKSIMDDLIRTRRPVASFSSTKDILSLLQFYVPQFIKSRIKAGIKIKLLTEKTTETEELMKEKDKSELRETRFIPKIGSIPNTVYIYGNKVAILNTEVDNPFGVLIENENIAKTHKLLFEAIWEKTKY